MSGELKKLLVVPLCFVGGLVLMLTFILVVAHEVRTHSREYSNTSDSQQMFLVVVWLTHQLLVLLVASVAGLGWMGLWLIGLLYAFDRLPTQ